MAKKVRVILLSTLFFTLIFSAYFIQQPKKTVSANLSNVKNTLSTSQLSYFARLGVGNSLSSTLIKIATSGNPSNTTSNLFTDDIISIGNTNATTLTNYTIRDVGNTASFQITTGLSSLNYHTGLAVIATRSAIHTVEFTPTSQLTGGAFQVLIKATNDGNPKYNDGLPDQDGFDLGADVGSTTTGSGTRLKDADITCPTIAGGSWTKTISATTIGSDTFWSISCTLGAGQTNAVGVGYSMIIGSPLASGSQLINPSPASGRTYADEGDADVYTFYVRHLDSAGNVVDSTQGKIAVVESVRVTATIDPTLTFIIDGVGTTSGNTVCGNVLGANASNTTPTAVKFGSLSIAAFNDLAQRLSCVTNASSGYSVTAFQNADLTNITTGTTIPATVCDSGPCTISSATDWATVTNTGFGYSLQNINADTVAFSYDSGTYYAKPFGTGYANAATIFNNSSTPTTTERVYVCYRLAVNTLQEAGDYENGITYTATATF